MAGPIRIAILADAAQAQAAFAKVAASADTMAVKVEKTGKLLTKTLTLPILAVGAASVDMATNFNSAMTKIQTQAGASAKSVRELSKQVLALAPTSQQSPVNLANALFHLKSVGLDNVKAMKALTEATKFANVGGADLEDTTNALAGAWRSGIKGAHNFHTEIGTLNAIIGAGNLRMGDLTDAIGTGFLPSARSFGLSLKSVGAALALMTDEGIPASSAATRLRMSFSLLGAPSEKAAGLLATIGLKSDALAKSMRSGGLIAAIGLLRDHLQGLNKVQQSTLLSQAFGGGRSSSAILTLLNNYDVLVKKQQQIVRTSGDVGKAIAAQAKTPQAQFELLLSVVETLGVKIGDQLLPDVIKLANGLNTLFTNISELPEPVKEVAGGLAAIAAVAGPLLLLGGALIRAFVAVAGAITFMGDAAGITAGRFAELNFAEQSIRFGSAIAGLAAFTFAMKTSNQELKDFLTVMGGAAVGFSVGGPIGAGVGALAGIFGLLATHMSDASGVAKTSEANYKGLQGTLDSLTGAVTADTRKFVENQLARSGALKNLAAFGITTRTAINAILGEGDARRTVSDAVKGQVENYKSLTAQIRALQKAQDAAVTAQGGARGGVRANADQRQRQREIDSLQAEADAEKKVIDAVKNGIPATHKAILLARQQIAATADYSGKLKGLPKAAKTQINAVGIVPTLKTVASLAKAYKLNPKQIRTVISASGVDTTVKQVKAVEKGLTDVANTKPDLSKYKSALGSQLDQAGGIGRAGGTEVGNAMANGLAGAIAAHSAEVARAASDLVSNAIAAARKAADAHSPSRKMFQLGVDMGQGATDGLNSTSDGLAKASKAMVQKALDAVKAQLQKFRSNEQQLSSTVSGNFRSDLFADSAAWGKTGNPIVTLKSDIANAKAFSSTLHRLAAEGLTRGAFASVASSNNLQAAQALASNPREAKQFERLFSKRQQITGNLGAQASQNVFGQKIDREVKLLHSIDTRLKHLAKETGRETGKAVNGSATTARRRRHP